MNHGDQWRHAKGGLYRIVCEALWVETGEAVVVYQSMEDLRIWARPLEVFLRRFTPELELGVTASAERTGRAPEGDD